MAHEIEMVNGQAAHRFACLRLWQFEQSSSHFVASSSAASKSDRRRSMATAASLRAGSV